MTAANAAHALALVLADELARLGLRDAVLAPGSRSAPLVMALHAHPGVRVHVRLDERSAAYAALGMTRASGRPAAVVTTSGTAAAIVHPAVLEADAARLPLLVLTADRPPELRHAGANQTVDQLGLFGRAVRWFCEVGAPEPLPGSPAYWRSTACHAWAAAIGAGGPAGPVHLNLALREPLVPEGPGFGQPLDGRPGAAPWTVVERAPVPPAPGDVERVAELVAAHPRGALVVGDCACDPGPLVELAVAAGWPLLAEPQSGARAGPNAVSTYDLLLRAQAFAAAHRPDVVLRVGSANLSRPLAAWLGAAGRHLLVDPDAAWLDPGRGVAEIVVADPTLLAADVAAALARARPRSAGAGGDGGWLAGWLDAERRARAALDAALDAEPAPSEPRVARDLAAALPDGALLVVASSMPVRDLAATMAPRRGLRVVGNRGASGIDGFCSTVLGAALAHHGPVAALAGDLSLLHDAAGLLTPGGPRPDAVLVVLHNDGGAIFSFLPQARHPGFEQLFGTPHGVDLAALAAAYGCGHRRMDDAGGLAEALADAWRDGGVQLVEVRTERAAGVALHRRLAEQVAAVVG